MSHPTPCLPALLLALSLSFTTDLRAQLGDAKGEAQTPLVPAAAIPPAPALSPAEALRSFHVAPGYRLELAAAEPLVQDPVAAVFGPDGRLWVVEMRAYMNDLDGSAEDAPNGRIVVLSDRDGDGRFDESRVFLDQLVLPRAVLPVAGGALVGAPPELAYWRDTDGDGRADRKEVLATDYGVRVDPRRPHFANPELAANSLLWTFDNWILSAAYTRKFRFNRGSWISAPTGFRGQWGLTQDAFGRLLHNSNSDQLRLDLIAPEHLQRNPNFPRLAGGSFNPADDQSVWPARVNPGVNRGYRPEVLREGRLRRFTAACAPWVYRGDLMPELAGTAFVAEPAANLVRCNALTPADGAVRAANRVEHDEFLTSTDERFRPVNFTTGPDGALYIVDLYRGVLQHRLSLTSYLREQSVSRGLVGPQHLGRIYRVVPDRAAGFAGLRYPARDSAEWIAKLAHPNSWWRETAQQVLVERSATADVPAIRAILRGPSANGRLHALWTLAGVGALTTADVVATLRDPEATVRVAGCRAAEELKPGALPAELVAPLAGLLDDPAAEVRLQAALALGAARDSSADLAVAAAVRRHPRQELLLDALCSGIGGREPSLLEALLRDPVWTSGETRASAVLRTLAQGIFATREPRAIAKVIELAAGGPATAVLLDGLAAGAKTERRAVALEAAPSGWENLRADVAHRARINTLGDRLAWPGHSGKTAAPPAPLTSTQLERFELGRTLFTGTCANCHHESGRGIEGLGPPLLDSEWVLGSSGKLTRVLLHGLGGPIKVRGRTYTGDMPAFGALPDEQVSAVLTYVRRAWGHDAAPVEPADVAAVRAATRDHSGAWSSEELRGVK